MAAIAMAAEPRNERQKAILILGRPNDPQSDADLRDFANRLFAKIKSAAKASEDDDDVAGLEHDKSS